MHHIISSANWIDEAQSRHRTDKLKHILVREMIGEAQTCQRTDQRSIDSQRTDSMHYTTSSVNWLAEAQTRKRINSMHHTTSSANWFAEAQTHQRTDSLKHKLVSELIPYTTQPHQPTDSLKHRPVSELISWSTDSLGNWWPKHRLVCELIGEA